MKIKSFLCVIFAIVAISLSAQTSQRTSLNITPQDITNIKAKITQYDWAKDRWAQIKAIANEAADDKSVIELPLRGGNWGHFYVDPEEGKPLVPGKYLGNWHWEHHNQAGTKTYLSVDSVKEKDYDGVLIMSKVHNGWANKLFSMALAYRVSGDKKYLTRSNEILAAYSRIYTKLPLHNKDGNSDPNNGVGVGRVSAQALDESVWLIKMLQGISLIWDEMTLVQQKDLKDNFLFPAADMIKSCHNLGIHNISCWYSAAVGMTGYLTANQNYIDWALHEKDRGLKYQLAQGFTPDGNWYENSPSYHFYAIQPIIYLAETAKNNGNSDFLGGIKKVLDAPLELMMPDMYTPRFNDCREVYLPAYSGYYEYGYARYKSKEFLPIIEKGRTYSGNKEKGNQLLSAVDVFDFSLLYSAPITEKVKPIQLKSLHLPGSGFDILTAGKEKDMTWMASIYDQTHTPGWHMHPDALDFVIYANSQQISMDPGHAEYGAPVHPGWYKTSIAHNVLVVNQQNQDFHHAKSLAYGVTKGIQYSFCETDSAYKGVVHTRAFVLVDKNTVLIADWIKADTASEFDISYHQRGVWKQKEKGTSWQIPDIIGYKYLRNAQIVSPDKRHAFSTVIDGKEIAVQTLSSQPVSLITAMGNGQDFEPTPYAITRYQGNQLFMLTLIKLNGKPEKVTFQLKDNHAKSPVFINLGNKIIKLNPSGQCMVGN
jgi:hypothetical protein